MARTVTPISVVHHTGLSIGAINVNTSIVRSSYNIGIITSVERGSISVGGTRTIIIPKNVPNMAGLSTSSFIGGYIYRTGSTNGLIYTVYTNPSIPKGLNILTNGGTMYCPKFRRCLISHIRASRFITTSNGTVATGNTNISIRFNLGVIRELYNRTRTREVFGSVRYGWGRDSRGG